MYEEEQKLRAMKENDIELCGIEENDIESCIMKENDIESCGLKENDIELEMREDDILFWKSRAKSLELENQMLHKHIKQMYLTMITHYNNLNQNEVVEENPCELEETKEPIVLYKKSVKVNKNREESNCEEENDLCKVPDKNNLLRNEEATRLYGSQFRKIIGMETAVLLNYDNFLSKNEARHWPVIALNFKK